jgi:hypothetical protein
MRLNELVQSTCNQTSLKMRKKILFFTKFVFSHSMTCDRWDKKIDSPVLAAISV